jgi:vacuolar-type H+-ATPase subunit F/Vma7
MPEQINENALAILGNPDVVLGFKALGFAVYPSQNAEDWPRLVDKIVSERAAICLVEEQIYLLIRDKINSYRQLPLPIFIPFAKDKRTETLDSITKEIRLRATGTF